MSQPYMGMHDGKIWDNTGLMGSIMGRFEDYYLDYMKFQKELPQIQDVINL